MKYIQFFQYDLSNTLSEGCGDRSVVVVDGRMSPANIGSIAKHECSKRGYVAWQVFQGESFTRSRPISQIWYVTNDKPVRNPVWLSAHD